MHTEGLYNENTAHQSNRNCINRRRSTRRTTNADADEGHEACLGKDLASELASNARSSAKKPAKNEAGLHAFSMIKHASRAR